MSPKNRQVAFEALETLAGLAKAGPAGRQVGKTAFALRKGGASPSLAEGEVVVIVADRDRLVVQTLRRPQRQPAPADVALRFAEIDAAVSQSLPGGELPGAEAEVGSLSASERQVLSRGGFDLAPLHPEERSPTFRTTVDYATLLEDSFTTDQAARRLKVNGSRVRQLLAARTLYGVKDRRGWRVPRFQFAGSRLVPGIDDVLPHLPAGLHPLAVHRWFTTPNPDLVDEEGDAAPMSPLAWLRSGLSVDVVAQLAAQL